MFTTLTVAALLAAVPDGGLKIADARLTYGILGPTRAETAYLPGDHVVVCFAVNGATPDQTGRFDYQSGLDLVNGQGKSVLSQPARPTTALLPLGGESFPAFAQLDLGLDQAPGDYTLRVTLTGKGAKATTAQKFTVKPRGFGLVRVAATCDPEGQIPAGPVSVGRTVWLQSAVVGFGRNGSTKRPDVALEARVLDESGKPTYPEPLRGSVGQNVPAEELALPVHRLVPLNRAGKFTLEVTATDRVTGKTATQKYPLHVHPAY